MYEASSSMLMADSNVLSTEIRKEEARQCCNLERRYAETRLRLSLAAEFFVFFWFWCSLSKEWKRAIANKMHTTWKEQCHTKAIFPLPFLSSS